MPPERPRIVYCLACEDVRPEINGKATILGFLGVVPHFGIGVADLSQSVPRFTLLFGIEGEGEHTAQFLILDPDGRDIYSSGKHAFLIGARPGSPFQLSNLMLGPVSLSFPKEGRYKVRAFLDEKLGYEDTFHVFKAPVIPFSFGGPS
jgi:hypothetical protein